MWHYGSNWNANPTMWIGMALGLIFLLILLALVIWVIVTMARKNAANSPDYPKNRSVETLKERYARGEIGTEEYRERMRELGDDKHG